MDIYYLYNSGFAVMLEESMLIFDYYKNVTADRKPKTLENGVIGAAELLRKKRVYVFVSHIHPDHFNPVIFRWQKIRKDITYVLDEALYRYAGHIKNGCLMKKGGLFDDGYMTVLACGSTDTGVSFYVRAEGKKIFHAGDLNWWHWREQSTPAQAEFSRNEFMDEIAYITQHTQKIDAAFFPLDPRQGAGFDDGAKIFIDMMKPRLFVPCHFMSDYRLTKEFAKTMAREDVKIAAITGRGARIQYE